jgi:hypothetical protein
MRDLVGMTITHAISKITRRHNWRVDYTAVFLNDKQIVGDQQNTTTLSEGDRLGLKDP